MGKMKELLKEIEELKKTTVKKLVDERIKEFKTAALKGKIFSELCFCILTANSTAERCIEVQKKAEKFFAVLSEKELAKKLKAYGARFYTKRANYIVEARKHKKELENLIKCKNLNEDKLRDWLVKNIKGIGLKEASHFMRNVGFSNVAIIDFHIVNLLVKKGLIKKPKKLDKKTYLRIEKLLRKIASKLKLSLAELDLYLWFIETEKVLK